MALSDNIHIAHRFLRSVRIDTDLGDPKALEGFICPNTSSEVLLSMAKHVEQTGQGAFTWTGPYGSGKSSLIVAFSALLNGDAASHKNSDKVFGKRVVSTIWKSLPTGKKGWRVIPVVGRRENPVQVIGEALKKAGLTSRIPKSEKRLMEIITEAVKSKLKHHGGLIIFIDEMGKFLEGAAYDDLDIYIFQQLAELAARSNGRLLLVGVLHQAFEEYGNRLSREMRGEWSKVQGRFVDLSVNANNEEQINLIALAIKTKRRIKEPGHEAQIIAGLVQRGVAKSSENLALLLENCWPLHPVVVALLGPISRRRFGQNQRSIFGFLNSAEPHGFQDFINQAEDDEIYEPYRLWDYLRVNLEASILASPDGHRWALAVEILERCEALGNDVMHINLLKTIAIIDLFKERSGLVASREILATCFTDISKNKLTETLKELDKQSLIIFKKFADAYAIYDGSDFDIEATMRSTLEDVRDIDFSALKELAGLQPILAKRHYHETGAMRWFEVNICSLSSAPEYAANFKPKNGIIGQFLLVIPSRSENQKMTKKICKETVNSSNHADVIVGTSPHSGTVFSLARELLALDTIRQDHHELAGDAVARRELDGHIAEVTNKLENEVNQIFDNALWYQKDDEPKVYHHAEINGLASDIADKRFHQSPRLHNELLNRQKPSVSASAARKALLHRMVLNEGDERLGIKGYSAEGGLFESLLEATKLYTFSEEKQQWHFQSPEQNDPCGVAKAWNAAFEYIESNQNQIIRISELYDIWREPPFGIKDGLMPILAVAFIMANREKVAIYREKVFRAQFDDVDIDLLVRDASIIQIRWMNLSKESTLILKGMADVVRDLSTKNKSVELEPLDVARGLVSIYEHLPEWTKRTMSLSEKTHKIRDLFKRAHDPNQFLFNDMPALMQVSNVKDNDDPEYVIASVRSGLGELVQAYPIMLDRLRNDMLTELRVMNTTPQALAGLRDRAENIRNISGDFHLNAFIGRLSQFNGSDEMFESIASLAANKPPRDWTDPDLDDVVIDLAKLAQEFVKIETFARVKGRKNKRRSIAVIIGMDEDRPVPVQEEFDVAVADDRDIKKVHKIVSDALDKADVQEHNLILAALAEIIANRIASSGKIKLKTKKKDI